jgi:hypothetical protein
VRTRSRLSSGVPGRRSMRAWGCSDVVVLADDGDGGPFSRGSRRYGWELTGGSQELPMAPGPYGPSQGVQVTGTPSSEPHPPRAADAGPSSRATVPSVPSRAGPCPSS